MNKAMFKNIPLIVDNKGRLTIPKTVRDALKIENGDVLFLRYDSNGGNLQITRAVQNPIKVLSNYADEEFEAEQTKNIRELLDSS